MKYFQNKILFLFSVGWPGNAMADGWQKVVDQILFVTEVICAYVDDSLTYCNLSWLIFYIWHSCVHAITHHYKDKGVEGTGQGV
jgi:hypothetical protein